VKEPKSSLCSTTRSRESSPRTIWPVERNAEYLQSIRVSIDEIERSQKSK